MLEPEGFVITKNMDNIPQFRNKKWAFVSAEKIKKAMMKVINNKEEIEELGGINYIMNLFVMIFNRIREIEKDMKGSK